MTSTKYGHGGRRGSGIVADPSACVAEGGWLSVGARWCGIQGGT